MQDTTWAEIAQVCGLDDTERAELEPVFDAVIARSDEPVTGIEVWRDLTTREVSVALGRAPFGKVRYLGEYASYPTAPGQGTSTQQD